MKDLVKKAVLKAHNNNDTVVETIDFVSGASYMLKALKDIGALKSKYHFIEMNEVDIYKHLENEANLEYEKKANL